ncbi:MAG: hypothetical protein CMN55_16650 [Sneathiella sp.]|nr:hypothetical protein [Sneathiella sp.]
MVMECSRDAAIQCGFDYYDSGAYLTDLSGKVRIMTESQNPDRHAVMLTYYDDNLIPAFREMGFDCQILDNPVNPAYPFLYAERIEDPACLTILGYGHGDVVLGMEDKWRDARSPWVLEQDGDRLYGRGAADNKGQHAINLAALAIVLKMKGALGFNAKYLIECGEEIGSPGLLEICAEKKELLSADLLVASDGPRQQADKPTIYLGSRGHRSFDLVVDLRDRAHHSGNWGGVIADAGTVLAQAIGCIVDKNGAIQVPGWRPAGIPDDVRHVLSGLTFNGGENLGEPLIEDNWGEPGLSTAEKLYAWSSFAVMAFETGTPAHPVGAIPGHAWARCGLRFPPGMDMQDWDGNLRRHLDANGFQNVQVVPQGKGNLDATRTELHNPWVRLACKSIQLTTGKEVVLLPNLAGSLPNGCFTDVLGLPTVWVPHSYPGCSQHAPDEHMLGSVAREALGVMAGLYWDLGDSDT